MMADAVGKDGPIRLRAVGEGALLIELGPSEPAVTARARGLAAAIRAASWPDVLDVVPAYRTVLVRFDPCLADGASLEAALALMSRDETLSLPATGRVVEIPVCYGGEYGPDLAGVAAHTGLSADAVMRMHAQGRYMVEFLGFSPGFPYLSGLPPALATPRLATPRVRVPAGSVAIGGNQTGFYPLPSPGGWRLIGRIPALRFDPARPETLPYAPGDTIRFVPIDAARFAALEEDAEKDVHHRVIMSHATPAGMQMPTAPARAPIFRADTETQRVHRDDRGGLRVLHAAGQITVQDLGRPGLAALGYSSAGALDGDALCLANRLVGNEMGAAALEIGGTVTLEAVGDLISAVVGVGCSATLDGAPLPQAQAAAFRTGMRLTVTCTGTRAYLAVGGGIATPDTLGSRSTDLVAGIGGLAGRALRADDLLSVGSPMTEVGYRPAGVPKQPGQDSTDVRVVWGPQDDWFDDEARARFLAGPFTVTARGDRTGMRLEGPHIAQARPRDLASEGGVPGAIQVPPDGAPIILLADGRGVGGYPKIAVVVGADLPRLAQARPGAVLRFVPISVAEARRLTCAHRRSVAEAPLVPIPETAVRCLLEDRGGGICPRSQACLISQRCLAPGVC